MLGIPSPCVALACLLASLFTCCALVAPMNALRALPSAYRTNVWQRYMVTTANNAVATQTFKQLGLSTDVLKALDAQGLQTPTPVQAKVIPSLLERKSIAVAAATGSGKTLAYVLPLVQSLHQEEATGYLRQAQRPRALILVPTRDLARQVLSTVKSVGHHAKIAAAGVLGGEQYSTQTRKLEGVVDVVVASPGRLLQHREQGHVFTSHVHTVVIDEVDTMLTQGFGADVKSVLRACMFRQQQTGQQLQLVMVTATMTKAVRSLLSDIRTGGLTALDKQGEAPSSSVPLDVAIVEVDGLHRSLPNVQHVFLQTNGEDKVLMLRDLLRQSTSRGHRVLVFCNTMQSCRAVDYALNEGGLRVVSYHGDLNSKEREANLDKYRAGEEKIMVCTDLAARGLDIPETDQVLLFDFPLNPVDYLHRAGRCGRAGRKGKVTSLVAKRDEVLARAMQGAIDRGLPLDELTSSKRDYAVKPAPRKRLLDAAPRPRPKSKDSWTPQAVKAVKKLKHETQRRKTMRTEKEENAKETLRRQTKNAKRREEGRDNARPRGRSGDDEGRSAERSSRGTKPSRSAEKPFKEHAERRGSSVTSVSHRSPPIRDLRKPASRAPPRDGGDDMDGDFPAPRRVRRATSEKPSRDSRSASSGRAATRGGARRGAPTRR